MRMIKIMVMTVMVLDKTCEVLGHRVEMYAGRL